MKEVKNIEKKKGNGKKLKDEFLKFIMRGNVLDLAVGVIVGGAFSKIVSSLVNDVLMPIIGVISGGVDFSSLSFKIKDATINYGMFIQNIIDFLIIAVCIFVFIKIVNNLFHKEKNKEEVKKVEKKSEEVVLLEEILKELKGGKVAKKATRKVKSKK